MLILALLIAVASPDVVVIDSRGDGFRSETSVNGFSTEHMPSVESITGRTSGYPGWEHRCFPVHPYFLKLGANVVAMTYTFDDSLVAREDKGPWTQSFEVVTTPLTGDDAKPVVLVKQVSPPVTKTTDTQPKKLTATFTLPTTTPTWRWTRGAAIADDKATAASLYTEYQKLWAAFDGMPKRSLDERSAFMATVRKSIDDFVRASELRGKPFKLLDELAYASATLGLIGDPTAAERKKAEEARAKKVPSTVAVNDAPADTGPNLDPHLTWTPLPKAESLKLVVFAGGRLAKLVAVEQRHVFGFTSNWTDGPWNSRGTEKLTFEAWYRKSAAGAWELDALYPTYWGGVASLSVSSMVDGMAF